MEIISTTELRNNLITYLEKIDEGEQILIVRKGKKTYRIEALEKNDIVLVKKKDNTKEK